jgi:2-oxoglutarate dehydrogenase E2 component (dihydrolipoamide succinyltransferase)
MATDVVMPQMGESIAEGTIVRWIKKVGDKVDRDEPLFEISTDKVDAEIPAPAAGVLSEIRHKEGETVPVNAVVAVIGQAAEAPSVRTPEAPAAGPVAAPAPSSQPDGSAQRTASSNAPAAEPAVPSLPPPAVPQAPTAAAVAERAAPSSPSDQGQHRRAEPVPDSMARQRSSPLVRKIAKEHNVDISQLQGSGISGRVTRDDILAYLGKEERAGQPGADRRMAGEARQETPAAAPKIAAGPALQPGASDRVEKMSVMRKRIAEHMIASRRTSAHVHSVFEVNFSRVAQIRDAKKKQFEAAGTKLTFLSFILSAAVEALRAVPIVNASVDGDNIVYRKDINIGVAVALDWGLIVPVIKDAGEKNLLGLSRAVADLAARARAKQLKPDEVSGGTFTITNPGVFGALFGMPIINQPQVAILGVGNIEKRPVVIDDAIAIRPMGYLTLGYDHRVIDGAVADEFLAHIKRSLENCDPAIA